MNLQLEVVNTFLNSSLPVHEIIVESSSGVTSIVRDEVVKYELAKMSTALTVDEAIVLVITVPTGSNAELWMKTILG